MTAPRCRCWKPSAPHEPTCPVRRDEERRDAAFELLLAPMLEPAVAREAERPREPEERR